MGGGSKKNLQDYKENVFNQSKHNSCLLKKRRNSTKGPSSTETIQQVKSACESLNKTLASTFQHFDEFPLSGLTVKGLTDAKFEKPTEIQRQSLPWSLTGRDVIGSAKTGSGKTWTRNDGLGALVIVPTRELAYQIFTVLNEVGQHHQFSAALLIGGTDVHYQMQRLMSINIVICTPGRLLQHLEENFNFNCEQLQLLVIDEADRILDMGFKSQMDAIMTYLPVQRQTLLFSATLTRNVDDLARVSVTNPVNINVHEHSNGATPDALTQNYMICNDEDKLNMLWSFLVSNKKSKILIFVSCCKQARFITEAFCHLRPGISLAGLWGTQKQNKRLEIFHKFDRKTNGAALIATDVASRGLDFENVDWVIQLDCPNDVEDYIHRVGRTARMDKPGRAILVLTPNQEQVFVERLKKARVPISVVSPDPKKVHDISQRLASTIASFPGLKEFAQASIVSYAKSIYFAKEKKVFDVSKVDFDALASSYGLPLTPRLRFLKKKAVQKVPKDQKEDKELNLKSILDKALVKDEVEVEEVALNKAELNEELEGDVLVMSKKDVFNTSAEEKKLVVPTKTKIGSGKAVSRQQTVKKLLKKGIPLNTKVVFNEDGELDDDALLKPVGLDLDAARKELESTSKEDKHRHKEIIKKLKRERRLKKSGKSKNADAELDLQSDDDDSGMPDLSWLPDPDKKYDDENSDHNSELERGDDDLSEEAESDSEANVNRKRKLNVVQNAEEKALKLMRF